MSIEDMSHGPITVSEIERLIAEGKVIPHEESSPDNKFPHVYWSQFGIIPTNEVAVVVRCGSLCFYARAPSEVLHPGMVERIYETDILDFELGQALTERLWEIYGTQLTLASRVACSDGSTTECKPPSSDSENST